MVVVATFDDPFANALDAAFRIVNAQVHEADNKSLCLCIVLTDDLNLSVGLMRLGIETINFNRFRFQRWSRR